MDKKRFCKNCGKELTTSARKCKYCNAEVPLDTYEISYRAKDSLKIFVKLLYAALFILLAWSIYCTITKVNTSSVNSILLRDSAIFGIVLITYFMYIFSLLKENG